MQNQNQPHISGAIFPALWASCSRVIARQAFWSELLEEWLTATSVNVHVPVLPNQWFYDSNLIHELRLFTKSEHKLIHSVLRISNNIFFLLTVNPILQAC